MYWRQENDLGPDEYSKFVMDWISKGARIIGGCCEIGQSISIEFQNTYILMATTMKLGL